MISIYRRTQLTRLLACVIHAPARHGAGSRPDRLAAPRAAVQGPRTARVANAEGLSGPLRRQGALGCNSWVAANRNPSTIDSFGAGQVLTLQLKQIGRLNRSRSFEARWHMGRSAPQKHGARARMSNARAAETDLPIGLMGIGLPLLSFVSSDDIWCCWCEALA